MPARSSSRCNAQHNRQSPCRRYLPSMQCSNCVSLLLARPSETAKQRDSLIRLRPRKRRCQYYSILTESPQIPLGLMRPSASKGHQRSCFRRRRIAKIRNTTNSVAKTNTPRTLETRTATSAGVVYSPVPVASAYVPRLPSSKTSETRSPSEARAAIPASTAITTSRARDPVAKVSEILPER